MLKNLQNYLLTQQLIINGNKNVTCCVTGLQANSVHTRILRNTWQTTSNRTSALHEN